MHGEHVCTETVVGAEFRCDMATLQNDSTSSDTGFFKGLQGGMDVGGGRGSSRKKKKTVIIFGFCKIVF